jgi:hypothetical protein
MGVARLLMCLTPQRASIAQLGTGANSSCALRLDQFPRMCAKSYRNLAKQQAAALTLRLALCDFA